MTFETPMLILTHLAAFSFFLSLAFSGFMVGAGLMDEPVSRSSHSRAVPTGGGIGIFAGLGGALLALSMFYPFFGNHSVLGALSALGLSVGLLGLCDDIYDMRPLAKFGLLVVVSAASVYVIGPPVQLPLGAAALIIPVFIGFAGAVLWMFVVINGVNFIDGTNGLMGGAMFSAFLAMTLVSAALGAVTSAVLAAVSAAALIGFLPYNAGRKAKVFSGDVGSLLIGFVYSVCALILVREAGAQYLYVGPMILLPFLADILLTMLRRARKGENLLAAHRSHLYQRLVVSGKSHPTVMWLYMAAIAFMGIVTLFGISNGLIASPFYIGGWSVLAVLVYTLMSRKLDKILQ